MITFKDMIGGFLNDSLLNGTGLEQRLLEKLRADARFFSGNQIIASPPTPTKNHGLYFYQNFLPNNEEAFKGFKQDEIETNAVIVRLLIDDLDAGLVNYTKDNYESYLRKFIGSKLSILNPELYSCISAYINLVKLTYDDDKKLDDLQNKVKNPKVSKSNQEEMQKEINQLENKKKGRPNYVSLNSPSSVPATSSRPSAAASASSSSEPLASVPTMRQAKKTSMDFSDIKDWIYGLTPAIKNLSEMFVGEIFEKAININPKGFFKINDLELKKIDKQINTLTTAFKTYYTKVIEDPALILTSEKRAYYDQFLKILPFFVDKSEVGAKDVFIDMLESKNYVLYFYLDGLYYEFINKSTDETAPNNHYIIDDDFKITKTNVLQFDNIINKSDTIKMTNIIKHKHYKNILVTQSDKSNVFRSFQNTFFIYKQYQNSDQGKKSMFRFIEYMFHQQGGNAEIVPKKPLIGNIFNLFILTGNFETMYKFFGSENTIDSETGLKVDLLLHPSNPANPSNPAESKKQQSPDISISLKELGMDKMTTEEEKDNHIRYFDITKLLVNKFRDFIGTNIQTFDVEIKPDTCDQIVQKINELIPRLNKISYPPGITDLARGYIEICKGHLITMFYHTAMFLMEPKNKEGVNLINAYNYFDIIENIDLLTNKIDEIEKKQRENPDSVSASDKQSLKDMMLKVNGNFRKPKSLVFYHLLFDISYLRKISHDAQMELQNPANTDNDLVFIDHLIDIMVTYRHDYSINIPFNKHLLTHSNRALRASPTRPDRVIDEIYGLVKTSFNTFCYGNFTRGSGPDCGETLILNLFNYLIFDKQTGKLDVSKLPDNVHPRIKSFYTKYDRLEKIDTNARYQWDEIMYDYEFVMQTIEYSVGTNIRYKVYSQFQNLNGFIDTIGIPKEQAIENNEIYDATGNLLPGKKENKYSGHTIRPGYIPIVRILNKLTGFDKISEKYNDRFVMSNLTLDSLKEILQTFKNSDRVDDYRAVAIDPERDDFYANQVNVSFGGTDNFELTMRYPHGNVKFGGQVSDDRRGADYFNTNSLYTKLSPPRNSSRLRYFQKVITNVNTYTSSACHFRATTYNIEQLKTTFKNIVENYLISGTSQSGYNIEFILNLIKLSLSEEEDFELSILPGEPFADAIKPEDNMFFKIFGKKSNGKLNFSFRAFNIFRILRNYNVIKHLIYYLDGVDNPINDRKDTILNLLCKFSNEDMIKKLVSEDKPNMLITNQYGNNILHYQQFVYDDYKIASNIQLLKGLVDQETWNRLISYRNRRGQVPFMAILYKAHIFIPELMLTSNRVKVDFIKQVLVDYFIKQNNTDLKKMNAQKRLDENQTNYNFLSKIKDIIDSITYPNIKNKVYSLLIKINFKNERLFTNQNHLISFRAFLIQNLYELGNEFSQDEIFFIRAMDLPYNLKDFSEDNLKNFHKIFNKEFIAKYNFNPWFGLNIDPSIKLEDYIKVLVDANKFDMLPLLGLARNHDLFKECANWSIKNFNSITGLDSLPEDIRTKGLKSLVDYNGNTIYHNLAIISRYLMIKGDLDEIDIKKLFKVLNKEANRQIFLMENKDGWKLIDILSWFPHVNDDIILGNSKVYENIRICLGLLDDYFKIFNQATQNIEDYVIVLTRHLINKWFRYFDKTQVLIGTLNALMERDPNISNKFLNRLDKTFNLHLYDDFLLPALNIDRKTYLSEPNYVIGIGLRGNILITKQTFKKSNDIVITNPLAENKLKKLNLKENPYNDIANAFDAITPKQQAHRADQVEVARVSKSASSNELEEKSAENKYYLLYKKYKTKYLTLREKLSK